jgi:molecular chaperone IbpA
VKTTSPANRRAQFVTLLKENVTMFDLTPLYRSTVGFDRLARMLDEASTFEAPTYPPYNIERLSDDEYRITMAVAGFGAEDINIEVKGNSLTVSGKKGEVKPETKTEYLHQGIASRAFERRFQLADHVQVKGADMENGLLHVSLKREVPEALKPRTIPVNGVNAPKVLEAKKAA